MPATPNPVRSGESPARTVVQVSQGLPRQLVSEYLDDCQKDLVALYAAVVERNYRYARVLGHQMKGTGSPYGFPSLTRLGTAVEQAAAREDALELENQVNQLGEYLDSVELACE